MKKINCPDLMMNMPTAIGHLLTIYSDGNGHDNNYALLELLTKLISTIIQKIIMLLCIWRELYKKIGLV